MSWELTRADLPDLARGAAFLGTGGGGDPYIGHKLVELALGEGSITILDPDEIADDLFVIPVALMGAPTVMIEKLLAGHEPLTALRHLEAHYGRRADATMPIECGGVNSLIPLLVAAQTGLPVVDADGMGRAFPELSMETFAVYGVNASPIALTAERGEHIILDTGADNRRIEQLARALTVELGGSAAIAEYAMTGADVRRTGVPRTISMALSIGRAIREARAEHRSPFEAIADALAPTLYSHVRELFVGKIVDVERRTEGGFARGRAKLVSADATDTSAFEIDFQNENLVARRDGRLVAIVPDLICVVDQETAEPITTEALRYGQRVRVLGVSTPALMRTPEALDTFGPPAFGLADAFVPVEELS